jgi:hypothetical protein
MALTAHRVGVASLLAGLIVVAAAQLTGPLAAPPLYDGIVPTEPYRWLSPPPGHPGGAQGASAKIEVDHGRSTLVALATPELSPQAQIFAVPGALKLPPGATSIDVSIEPVEPSSLPTNGYIDGNVYRVLLVDQRGQAVTAPRASRVSVVLRSADPSLTSALVERFNGIAWKPVKTTPAGIGGYLAIVTEFGDFAVVAKGTSPYPSQPPSGGPIAALGSPGAASPGRASTSNPTPSAGTGLPVGLIVVVLAGGTFLVVAAVRSRLQSRTYRGAHWQRRR